MIYVENIITIYPYISESERAERLICYSLVLLDESHNPISFFLPVDAGVE